MSRPRTGVVHTVCVLRPMKSDNNRASPYCEDVWYNSASFSHVRSKTAYLTCLECLAYWMEAETPWTDITGIYLMRWR
jgi:hypothetical protein